MAANLSKGSLRLNFGKMANFAKYSKVSNNVNLAQNLRCNLHSLTATWKINIKAG